MFRRDAETSGTGSFLCGTHKGKCAVILSLELFDSNFVGIEINLDDGAVREGVALDAAIGREELVPADGLMRQFFRHGAGFLNFCDFGLSGLNAQILRSSVQPGVRMPSAPPASLCGGITSGCRLS